MVKKELLDYLKKMKLKTKILIPYKMLNDELDKISPTDIDNKIYDTFKDGKYSKDADDILTALFDGYSVVYDKKSKNYSIVDKKGNTAELTIKEDKTKNNIVFDAKDANIKIRVEFGTPKTIDKFFGTASHKQLVDDLMKAKNEKDLDRIYNTIKNMKMK